MRLATSPRPTSGMFPSNRPGGGGEGQERRGWDGIRGLKEGRVQGKACHDELTEFHADLVRTESGACQSLPLQVSLIYMFYPPPKPETNVA